MTPEALRPPERVNLAGQDTGRDHLSHSGLRTFLACEQRFYWSREQRLEPAIPAAHLNLGRAFATALEQDDPEAGSRAIHVEADEQADRAAGSPWVAAPNRDDVEKDAAVIEAAAAAYLTKYGSSDVERELEFRARIRNPAPGGRYSLTHDVMCRVDALSPDRLDLFEDKLVSQIPQKDLAPRMRLDRQVTIQCYLIWRCTGILVERVHYRMTRKPQIRQRQNESHDDYLLRVRDDYQERPDFYLHEEPVTRTEADFVRLEQELWRWAEQIRNARRDGVWPRDTDQCHEFGGCAFLPLCAREPGAEHQYVTRPERDTAPTAPVVSGEQTKEAA